MKNIDKKRGAMIALVCATVAFAALFGWQYITNKQLQGNFTDDMKIPYAINLNDHGANEVERQGDHTDTPYFTKLDFYSMKSTDTRFILPQFRTIQQTTWWSCGISSTMMVMDYFGELGDWNEETLASLRTDHSDQHKGTCLDQMIEMLDKVGGFTLETTYDYADNLDAINGAWFREQIKAGAPVLIGWNDWGGHWQVAIGYDTMGTEYEDDDVLIVADPYDTTDHNQDGYGVYSMERFITAFSFYDFFPENEMREKCFVAIKPKK